MTNQGLRDLTRLKNMLWEHPLKYMVPAIHQLDRTEVDALHSIQFSHQLLNVFLRKPDFHLDESLIIEAMAALERCDCDHYNLQNGVGQNLLELAVECLLKNRSRVSHGNQLIAHLASRVANINRIQSTPSWTNSGLTTVLMDAVIVADTGLAKILMDNGADPNAKGGRGHDCHYVNESTNKQIITHHEAYLDFKVMFLLYEHQQTLLSKRPTRPAL